MKRVDEGENDMADGWKDDIDTMLVFVRSLQTINDFEALLTNNIGWSILRRRHSIRD